MISKAVIALLKQERLSRGLSVNEVAQRAGVDRVSLGRVEKENRYPGLWYLIDVADAIGIDLKTCIKKAEKQLDGKAKVKKKSRK